MHNYVRLLNLDFVHLKSCFLFGPRQTGKSSLIKNLFPDAIYINLLHSDNYLKFSREPSLLREIVDNLKDKKKLIIIDEIQKVPLLLDEVHDLIEKGHKFIMTGSSARKLKRGGANLLGGRARERRLFPLTTNEIGDFEFLRMINFGGLPSIYLSDSPEEDLESYVGTYLKEEIQAESVVRNLINFSKFLEVASLTNAELVNYSNIASDVGVTVKTIQSYYEILSDTLVGSILPPFEKTKNRKSTTISKFYYFDVGVANYLAGRFHIEIRSEVFGRAFEHFIYCEIRSYLSYTNDKRKLSFWRTSDGKFEVDFLIGEDTAIEVKGTKQVLSKHMKGLLELSSEIKLKNKIIVSLETHARTCAEDIEVLPYGDFLKKLWLKKF
jgi:predicted AAA+ superfamily ATPase